MLTIIVRSAFEDEGKFFPQAYLDECLYELQRLEYDRIDISEGIDINKTNASKECVFVPIGILKILVLSMSHIFAVVVMIRPKAMIFDDVVIVYVKGKVHLC